MNVTTRYECPICHKRHGSAPEADGCCEKPIAKEVLICGECRQSFTVRDVAEACCLKIVRKRLCDAAKRQAETYCLCGAELSPADERDSKLVGSLRRCRACILKVAPEMVAA